MSDRLKGRIAIVTGAGRGIGRAVAIAYAREGATLALCSRTKDELEAAAAEVQKSGGKVFARTVDLSVREAVRGFAEETVKRFGRIDVLVNNAGALG
ncbi:MAG: SDR family NAD(P)-dependent oxidoreductase, partial [Elusimicrobiota bacterium]